MDIRGIELSFGWLFSIIVGAVIIFLSIYATTSIIGSGQTEINSKVSAQLGVILNPVGTNLEDGKYAIISFPDETKFFNDCKELGNFGRQIVSTSVRSGIGKEFKEPLVKISLFNKYIFSEKIEKGKELHIFSKSFKMPYKIGDLIIASSKKYCFVDAPDYIRDEIYGLNPENINLSDSLGECPKRSKSVCFLETGCDIEVDIQSKEVKKEGKTLYYEDSLIYGAIFSDPEIYECQVSRLMKRTGEIARLYSSKSEFLLGKGCSSGLSNELRNFASSSQINDGENSAKLKQVSDNAQKLERKNEILVCKLF